MQRDGLTLGWGMAGCTWIAGRFAAAGETGDGEPCPAVLLAVREPIERLESGLMAAVGREQIAVRLDGATEILQLLLPELTDAELADLVQLRGGTR